MGHGTQHRTSLRTQHCISRRPKPSAFRQAPTSRICRTVANATPTTSATVATAAPQRPFLESTCAKAVPTGSSAITTVTATTVTSATSPLHGPTHRCACFSWQTTRRAQATSNARTQTTAGTGALKIWPSASCVVCLSIRSPQAQPSDGTNRTRAHPLLIRILR